MSESRGDPLARTAAITAVGIVIALAAAFVFDAILHGRLTDHPRLAFAFRLKLVVSTFNVILLLALTGTYLNLYRELPNQFTRSLILFTLALLFYALTSNPIAALVFGFRPQLGLGPFTFLPDLFAAVAIVVLLHQSFK